MSDHIWNDNHPKISVEHLTYDCSICGLHRYRYSDYDLKDIPIEDWYSNRYAYRISFKDVGAEWVYDREPPGPPTCDEFIMNRVLE